MKRLVAAGLLCVATAALAQDGGTPKKMDGGSGSVGSKLTGAVHEATGAIQHTEAKIRGTDKAPKPVPLPTDAQGSFKTTQAFDLKGTVIKPGAMSFTIARPGLPPAELHVRDATVVLLDGQKVAPQNLPEGAQVRAKFQLEGEVAVALRVEASGGSSATGGSGDVKDPP